MPIKPKPPAKPLAAGFQINRPGVSTPSAPRAGALASMADARKSEIARVNVFYRPSDWERLSEIRSEVSDFLNPLPMSLLLEWVCVKAQKNPSMMERAKEQMGGLKDWRSSNEEKKSSLLVDTRIARLIMGRTHPLTSKNLSLFVRWIAEDWIWIKKASQGTK